MRFMIDHIVVNMHRKLVEFINDFKYVPYALNKNSKCEVGKIYWCGYWEKTYKVLEVNGYNVKIRWQDGKIAEHCTSLDIHRDYELKPFKYKNGTEVINGRYSFTLAEIKALIINGSISDEYVIRALIEQYFKSDHVPNDYNYYYLRKINDGDSIKVRLKRDLKRSPHNFYNIKTLDDVYKDTRIALYEFIDMDGNIITEDKMKLVPVETSVTKIEFITGAKYRITLEVRFFSGCK